MMNWLRHVARYLMGVVFIFSGFVKVIDPLGYAYKISDYFDAFGMAWLSIFAMVLAIVISGAEMLIGLALVFKLRMRQASWTLSGFMVFFTVLTLIIAITNPVTDCGCFGDAIILTNWQTFFKNLIFLIPTSIVFFERNRFKEMFQQKTEWVLITSMFALIVLLSVHCLRNLPIIDFRPYHVGANIEEGMQVPEGMPVDEFETVLVYEKDGVSQEFTLASPEQPWADSTWNWVETQNKLIKKGYEPPIHDFMLVSEMGEDITDWLLQYEGYSLLIISYDMDKASSKGLKRVKKFTEHAIENGMDVYGMTASLREDVDMVNKQHDLPFEMYTTDEITLKTMVRSNPGVILIKEGTVLGKWHHRNVPDSSFFSSQHLGTAISILEEQKNINLSFLVILVVGIFGVVISYFRLRI